MGNFDKFLEQCNPANIPTGTKDVLLICGILDLFFFGVGTIVLGCVSGNMWCACVGVVQLVIPFVGWFWSFIWGIIIIVKALSL